MKHTHKLFYSALIMALLASVLIASTAVAAGEPVVTAVRLEGTKIGIKIEFSEDISGDFAGFMWGRYFDCKTVSSRVVYCIGPMAPWIQSGLFYLYPKNSNTATLIKLIMIPPEPHHPIRREPCPPQECDAPR